GEATVLAGVSAGASIWYAWTAPSDGTVTLDTTGSSFDTLLGVSTGSAVDTLTPVASGDDVKGASTTRVRFAAVSGTLYRIRVDGFDGSTGDVRLHLHQAPPSPAPVNDDFAKAIQLAGENVSRVGDTNLGASVQTGEATAIGTAPVRTSVWYA